MRWIWQFFSDTLLLKLLKTSRLIHWDTKCFKLKFTLLASVQRTDRILFTLFYSVILFFTFTNSKSVLTQILSFKAGWFCRYCYRYLLNSSKWILFDQSFSDSIKSVVRPDDRSHRNFRWTFLKSWIFNLWRGRQTSADFDTKQVNLSHNFLSQLLAKPLGICWFISNILGNAICEVYYQNCWCKFIVLSLWPFVYNTEQRNAPNRVLVPIFAARVLCPSLEASLH